MDRRPLISIVIPAYNRAATIKAALKSIQDQTYRNWEAIVVDDGSKDDTVMIVEQLAKSDQRIRIVSHEHNRRAQAARNTGIHAARGEWIAFLDSDDQYVPESLELRLNLALQKNVEVVHSNAYIVRQDNQKRIYSMPAFEGKVYRQVLAQPSPAFSTLLIKRQALARINFLDERIVSHQEWDTSIRLAKYFSFAFEPRPTFVYDFRAPDAMSKDTVRNRRGYEQIVKKHLFDILRYAGPATLSSHCDRIAKYYATVNNGLKARQFTILAFVFKRLGLAGRIWEKILSGIRTVIKTPWRAEI